MNSQSSSPQTAAHTHTESAFLSTVFEKSPRDPRTGRSAQAAEVAEESGGTPSVNNTL